MANLKLKAEPRADLGKMTDLTNIVLDRAFAAAAVV